MMDYAVNSCHMDADWFFTMFISSGAARQFEKGTPRYVAGMTGGELANKVVLKITNQELTEPEEYFLDKSPEYWCGWIQAYYQWRTGRSFQKIHNIISMEDILYMYPTHHEADEEKFVDTVNQIYEKKHTKSYLQQIREVCRMSIGELAEEAGIEAGILTQMEQDYAKINETDAVVLFRLAQVLGCGMENLLEI